MDNTGSITAIDRFNAKINIINEAAERLSVKNLEAVLDDAFTYTSEKLFDIVHTDVPCSGLGTLSKKPDIKWKREREDIYRLQDSQRKIMENASRLVKPGGVLLYSTCTIEPEENMENVQWFLKNHQNFKLDPAENYLHRDLCFEGCMQTFQHIHDMDGAFAARLIRTE